MHVGTIKNNGFILIATAVEATIGSITDATADSIRTIID
jgi:hypothetical protein